MEKKYPIEFTLENGTQVVVTKDTDQNYHFSLTTDNGNNNQFSYSDNETFTQEKEAALNFDQLNALRRFWLEQEKDELS